MNTRSSDDKSNSSNPPITPNPSLNEEEEEKEFGTVDGGITNRNYSNKDATAPVPTKFRKVTSYIISLFESIDLTLSQQNQ